jgi:hypothetical protein
VIGNGAPVCCWTAAGEDMERRARRPNRRQGVGSTGSTDRVSREGFCQLAPFDYDPGRWVRPATHASLAPAAGRGRSGLPEDHRRGAAGHRASHVELMRGDESPPALLNGNFHHLGTTRMHPAAGTLNR